MDATELIAGVLQTVALALVHRFDAVEQESDYAIARRALLTSDSSSTTRPVS